MSVITSLTAREILDSRGNPTIEATCELASGAVGSASVPSGASTGVHEALELRDGDMTQHDGKGVGMAIGHINGEIASRLNSIELDQRMLDEALIALDATPNKSRLGANATLGVSLAFARACAVEKNIELYEHIGMLSSTPSRALPLPALNIINGGKHADSGLDIQEFMIVPVGFDSFKEKIDASERVINELKTILESQGLETTLGDEGGFAPKLAHNEVAFELLLTAITNAGYTTEQMKLAIDVAASSFYANGTYTLAVGGIKKDMTTDEMIAWYEDLVSRYPIISIEDGLAEDDWDGFSKLTNELGDHVQIVGDDLTVTNIARISTAIEKHAINAVLIKPNQIGTLTETLDAIALTKKSGWKPFVSHRSGETLDNFIADLVVGTGSPFIKAGSLTKRERLCKYERLVEIEKRLS